MKTLADAEARYGITHLEYLDRCAELPVIYQRGAQGDVHLRRHDDAAPSTEQVPARGFPVVRGENGGNTHAVFGPVCYTPSPAAGDDPADLVLGTLTVPEGAQALLSHPEHGGLLVEPGTWVVKRQREQADVARFVED